jgi:hypothetical protein
LSIFFEDPGSNLGGRKIFSDQKYFVSFWIMILKGDLHCFIIKLYFPLVLSWPRPYKFQNLFSLSSAVRGMVVKAQFISNIEQTYYQLSFITNHMTEEHALSLCMEATLP